MAGELALEAALHSCLCHYHLTLEPPKDLGMWLQTLFFSMVTHHASCCA